MHQLFAHENSMHFRGWIVQLGNNAVPVLVLIPMFEDLPAGENSQVELFFLVQDLEQTSAGTTIRI